MAMDISRRRRVGLAVVALGPVAAFTILAGAAPALAQGSRLARTPIPIPLSRVAAGWGANHLGQLCNGTVGTPNNPGSVPVPTQITSLGTSLKQVSAGGGFGLALRSDGTVWACGYGFDGELGPANQGFGTSPVQVPGLSGIVAVAAGNRHSLALASDGTVWAWGDNAWGELGNGTTGGTDPSPARVTGLTGVTSVAASEDFSEALRSDGTVWTWGLGGGPVPARVRGLSRVTSIAAGGDFSLAVRKNPLTGATSVLAWGRNGAGQLGDGTTTQRARPAVVTGIGAPAIAAVTAGSDFSLALGTDGSVWGWGNDNLGQLGDAATAAGVYRPVLTIPAGSGITQVSAGFNHALALRSNGTALGWGANYFGTVGDGGFATSSTPVQVTGLSGAVQVSAGFNFSLAVYQQPPVNKL